MSAIRPMLCRLGMHEWRSGICFHCGKKEQPSGSAAAGAGGRTPTRVSPARSEETRALPGHTAVAPSPPKSIAPPPPVAPLAPASAGEEATVAAEWRLGEVILDLYEVKEVFTTGGMGLVYRVHHCGWNIDLAVKSPRAEHFRSAAQRQRFEAEIDAWIGLGLHPHIVSCYYVRTLGGIPRVFAEFVAGGTLAAWIRDRRIYAGGREAAQERLLDVAMQIAWAMGYAHTQGAGLVHQDLKPLNVLLTPEGAAKVTDFGLAQARAQAGVAEAAADGRTVYVAGCGLLTPAYASPEQYAQGQGVALSRKTDLWSWAVLVLEMYLGGLPWDPRIPGHVALAHGLEGYLQSSAQDPANPPLPPALQELVRHCLKSNPAERPADFRAVAERLAGIYRAVVGRDYPRAPPAPAELQADAMSNRAISMLDLGREAEAQALFEQAVAQEPGHPQATYNWGLVRWRRGEITDLDLVQQLEQARANRPESWMPPYLLGLVHLERRDAAGAQAALIAAQGLADRADVRAAIDLVNRIPASAGTCLAVMEGHTDQVTSVALSADGRRALSGSADKTLRLWDLDSGKCRRTLVGHTREVTSVALSADGHQALSGSDDIIPRLWELESGRCLRTLTGHASPFAPSCVALSAHGGRALSVSDDKKLRLWELANGGRLRILAGHTNWVRSVALSADGRRALSGSYDETLRLWDLDSGECLRTLEGHIGWVSSVALSADGRTALSGGWDNTLIRWDLDSARYSPLKGHTGEVISVALSADGRRALSASGDNTLRLWDIQTGQCLRTQTEHTQEITSVALSADGSRSLSGSKDKTIRLWDIDAWLDEDPALKAPLAVSEVMDASALLTVQQQYRDLLAQADAALAADQWPEAWRLAGQAGALPGYSFDPGVLQRAHLAGWRAGVRRVLRKAWCRKILKGHSAGVISVVINRDGRRALSGSGDRTLRLWNLDSGECLRALEGHIDWVSSVALSADGHRALSGSGDRTLRLWNLENGECLRVLDGHIDGVRSVALSADGRLALSGGGNPSDTEGTEKEPEDTLCLWDLDTGRCLRTLNAGEVFFVALSSDIRQALVSSGYSRLCLWDLENRACLKTLSGHPGWPVRSLALSTDGHRALSGSDDKTLRVWDLDTGECLSTLEGHTDWVTSVALTPDGRWALSGSVDKTLRLWDLDRGVCVRTLDGHSREVTSVALAADGRWALSGSHDNTLRLWELEWDYTFPEPQD